MIIITQAIADMNCYLPNEITQVIADMNCFDNLPNEITQVIADMNCFDNLPSEIIIHIYSFTPESYPMLRKVNCRWRTALEHTTVNISRCMQYAAIHGYKIFLGELCQSDIRSYLDDNLYDVLMRADYTWKCDELQPDPEFLINAFIKYNKYIYNNDALCQTLYQRYYLRAAIRFEPIQYLTNILFERIITKCTTRDNTIATMVVLLNNVYLFNRAHDNGILFNDDSFRVAKYSIFVELCDLGYRIPDDILTVILDRIIDQHPMCMDVYFEYKDMIQFAIIRGCKITEYNFEQARQLGIQQLLQQYRRINL